MPRRLLFLGVTRVKSFFFFSYFSVNLQETNNQSKKKKKSSYFSADLQETNNNAHEAFICGCNQVNKKIKRLC